MNLPKFLAACCAMLVSLSESRGQSPAQPIAATPAPPASPTSTIVSVHTVTPVAAQMALAIINPDSTEQDQQGSYFRSSNGKVREDTVAGSVITDFQAGTITTLNPVTSQATVMSTPGPKGRYVQRNPLAVTPTVTSLGETTVEGHPVAMKLITTGTTGQSAEIWTATDIRLTVLVKATSSTGVITTKAYQNIQLVEPDPSLFTVPASYTVVQATPVSATPAQVAQQ